MLEYAIPAARLASAVIVFACFVIALILINGSASGSPRRHALLGITLVMGSTVLQSLNGSMAAAYGTETVTYTVGSLLVAALAAGGLLLVVLGLVRSPRRSTWPVRLLAVLGSALVVLGVIARFGFHVLSPYLGTADTDVIVTALVVDTLAAGVLTGVGMLLLTRAVVVAA